MARAAAALVAAFALLVLVGWALGAPRLTSVLSGRVPMNPLTAVAFLLSGVSLWLQVRPCDARAPRAGRLAGGAVALVGLVRLAGYLGGWEVGVDRLLFASRLESVPFAPNRMAPNTAAGFVLAGLALALLDVETRRGRRPAQHLALAAAALGLVVATGYGYRASALQRVTWYIPMALNTAVCFGVLAIGILLARPDRGWMRPLTSAGAGGVTARRLLPAAILVPWVLGWLRLQGEEAGLYGTQLGVAIFAVGTMVVMTVLIAVDATLLDRSDAERRRAEESLQRQAAEIRDLYDHAPCGYHSLDADGVFVRVNATELGWLGYAADELIGRRRFADLLSPASRERFALTFPAFKASGSVRELEFELVRKDGTILPVLLSATAITDAEGRYVASRSIVFDITERKRVERELARLQAQREAHAARLEAANAELQAFSYSVSHDLRAPLRAIDGFTRILVEDHAAQLDAEARRVLAVVCDNARHMGRLIDDLLALSRLGRRGLERTRVDVAALARAVVEELRRLEGERRLTVVIGELPPAHADPGMLRQALANLIGNAFKFTRRRPHATIEIGAERRGGETVYRVRDDGTGFDMRYVDKVFQVFQRLHRSEDFEGTGIGLAIVQRVIQRHGGRIWAEGVVDGGAAFYFTLPPEEVLADARHGRDPAG